MLYLMHTSNKARHIMYYINLRVIATWHLALLLCQAAPILDLRTPRLVKL